MTPFQITFDPASGCYFIAIVGKVTPSDSAQLIAYLNQDPNLCKATCHLIDMRSATYHLDAPTQEHLASTMKQETVAHRLRVPRAIVLNEGISKGVVDQFLAMTGGSENSRFFTEMKEARAWLGLPPLLPAY